MDPQPYISGFRPADSGPLSRFLPALDDGIVSAWLAQLDKAPDWLLDPFGFSPQLVLEAARSGYRVLVTANNPVTRFLLEMAANPPAQAEFSAALADLGAIKKGGERLGAHLQSLYLTCCEKCGEQIQAASFLWRKGAGFPYARVYECAHCGDAGERLVTDDDLERVKRIAATDGLHRSRAFEKVIALYDEDRFYAEEAIQHYLPRPLYVLTTIINRLDSLNLSPERKRALTGLILLACDAGNTLWAHPADRPRPKQLSTPHQFHEHNVWRMLERGLNLWTGTGAPVTVETWPNKLPGSGGICIYEGRLKDLADIVKKEIPITAVIGSIPRPNQAFWTLSALWTGWLWGREAVEPYKVALRRRRYDWAWNATALHAAFGHLSDLLPGDVPFFSLLPEPEPAYLTSVFSAMSSTDWRLQSAALRTEHDPLQIVWRKGQKQKPRNMESINLPSVLQEYLKLRGEPARYLHLHTAGLTTLAEMNAVKGPGLEFDAALRKTHILFESAMKDTRFIHHSAGENIESGLWGLNGGLPADESLPDRVEVAIVTYLQKNPKALFLEIENDLYARFTGLMTPSKGLIYAVLNSYAEKEAGYWKLRVEDAAAARRGELRHISGLIETIGKKLNYRVRRQDKTLFWEENGKTVHSFYVMASALINPALEGSAPGTMLVLPGGRAALVAYKQERDPLLAARMKNYRVVKYRLIRSISEVTILTRGSFNEQLASDPVKQGSGAQMMMF